MKKLFLLIIFLQIFVACDYNSYKDDVSLDYSTKSMSSSSYNESSYGESSSNLDSAASASIETSPNSTTEELTTNRKIIRNGQITLKVEDAPFKINLIRDEIKKYNGYIISSSESNISYNSNYFINLKVPFDKFDQFIQFLEKNCGKVISKDVSTNDVTAEFYDNAARLKSKKILEERYFSLLSQTKKVSEIIEIEDKLNEVRSDIESMEGRQKYLSQNTSYSELNINFISSDSTFKFGMKKLFKAFEDSFYYLFEFILILIRTLPNIVVSILIIFGLFKLYKRIKKN